MRCDLSRKSRLARTTSAEIHKRPGRVYMGGWARHTPAFPACPQAATERLHQPAPALHAARAARLG